MAGSFEKQIKMNTLFLVCGCSGAGKSTFAMDFCRENREGYSSAFMIRINPDEIRGIIGKNEGDQSVNGRVFESARVMAEILLKRGQSTLLDATNLSVKTRAEFIKIAKKCNARVVAYVFQRDLETCKKQNQLRERKVPDEVIERQFKSFVVPSKEEGVDDIVFV